MKAQTVCFTGHRDIPAAIRQPLLRQLRETVCLLIQKGYRRFCTGGALGFDTMAAQTVLELKAQYPDIELILMLPCLSQADRWSDADRAVYADIRAQADQVFYTSQAYTRSCMLQRNRRLVDASSVCVSYMTRSTGGTAYTVRYAQTNGVPVIRLG